MCDLWVAFNGYFYKSGKARRCIGPPRYNGPNGHPPLPQGPPIRRALESGSPRIPIDWTNTTILNPFETIEDLLYKASDL